MRSHAHGMFDGREHGESESMRTLTTLVGTLVMVSSSGCFSLFNPWSGVTSKKQDPNAGTIDGQVFKTGTATYAKWDTTLDISPKILHETQKGDRWQISNNPSDGSTLARKGFVFIVRKKRPNEQLASFIVDEWHPQKQDVDLIQDTEWMGIKGVKNDNRFGGAQMMDLVQYAGESGNCFYALNVYTWGKKGEYGDYKMLADLAMQSIHGSAGGLPSPPQCK